jgi:hypothetical protein
MTNERDTHFANAGKLLSERLSALYLSKGLEAILGDPNGTVKQQEITLFAQFAYDVGEHVFNHTTEAMTLFDSFESVVKLGEIPDLTAWPE